MKAKTKDDRLFAMLQWVDSDFKLCPAFAKENTHAISFWLYGVYSLLFSVSRQWCLCCRFIGLLFLCFCVIILFTDLKHVVLTNKTTVLPVRHTSFVRLYQNVFEPQQASVRHSHNRHNVFRSVPPTINLSCFNTSHLTFVRVWNGRRSLEPVRTEPVVRRQTFGDHVRCVRFDIRPSSRHLPLPRIAAPDWRDLPEQHARLRSDCNRADWIR